MSAAAPFRLQIPVDWVKALPYLADLRDRMPLSADDWHQLCEWLAHTKFDEQGCLAGEVAGVLIRDYAPAEVRQEIARLVLQTQFPPRLQSLLASISSV